MNYLRKFDEIRKTQNLKGYLKKNSNVLCEYVITSDTLHYNTLVKLAHLTGPSNITSGDSRIYTERADFNTLTNKSTLLDRSVLVDKDKQMIGDSVIYDRTTGVAQAFNDIIFNDKTNKNIFTGDYFYYND